jgi:hypothetical protein
MFIRFNDLLVRPFLAPEGAGGGEAGAEVSESAEPTEAEVTEGVEETEVAEQSTGKTDADARFAQMRRENEQLRAERDQLNETLGLFFEGDTDQKIVSAQAMAQNKTEDEIRAEIEAENERERLEDELAQKESELLSYRVQARMSEDLKAIQAIDPNVKDLDSLGQDYFDLIADDKISAVQAYFAAKAKAAAEKAVAPAEVGKVNQSEGPKDSYTKEEVEAMSPAEVREHYDAIRQSMKMWK